MNWFEGRDTAGFYRFLNLNLASQVILSTDDMNRPTATVIIDYKTVTFRDPDTLEKLKSVLTSKTGPPVVPYKPGKSALEPVKDKYANPWPLPVDVPRVEGVVDAS